MRKSLTKREILRKKSEIKRVFSRGNGVSCEGARLIWIKNGLNLSRILITPTRKFGRAVDRNRVRRLCKEIFRQNKESISWGYDLIFVIYPGYGDDYHQWYARYSLLIKKAKLSLSQGPEVNSREGL